MREKVYFGPGIRPDWEQTTIGFDFMIAQTTLELSLMSRSCVSCSTENIVCQDTLLQGCQFNAVFYLFVRSGTEELGLIIRSLGPRPPSCLYHAYFSGIWFEPQGVLLNKWVTQESITIVLMWKTLEDVYFLPLTNVPWFLIIFQVIIFALET